MHINSIGLLPGAQIRGDSGLMVIRVKFLFTKSIIEAVLTGIPISKRECGTLDPGIAVG